MRGQKKFKEVNSLTEWDMNSHDQEHFFVVAIRRDVEENEKCLAARA